MRVVDEASLPVRLLRLLARGGIRSTSELAGKLGVSSDLVTMIAEDLMRRGYLVALSGGECSAGCTPCSLTVDCSNAAGRDRLPLLALTPRGRRMAAR